MLITVRICVMRQNQVLLIICLSFPGQGKARFGNYYKERKQIPEVIRCCAGYETFA